MNYELYHYGVKGMKWGVRKEKLDEFIKTRTALEKREKSTDNTYSKKLNRYNNLIDKAYKNYLENDPEVPYKNYLENNPEVRKNIDAAREEVKMAEKKNNQVKAQIYKHAEESRREFFENAEFKARLEEIDTLHPRTGLKKDQDNYYRAVKRLAEEMVKGYGNLTVESLTGSQGQTYSDWVQKKIVNYLWDGV